MLLFIVVARARVYAIQYQTEAHLARAAFLERHGRISEARGVFESLTTDGGVGCGQIEAIVKHANLERRHTSTVLGKETGDPKGRPAGAEGRPDGAMARVTDVFEAALARAAPSVGALTGEAREFVALQLIRYLGTYCGNVQAARAAARAAIAGSAETRRSKPLWLALLRLEMDRGTAGREDAHRVFEEAIAEKSELTEVVKGELWQVRVELEEDHVWQW